MGGVGKLVTGIWGWARLTSVGEEARSRQGSGARADPRTKVFGRSIKNTAWSVGTGLPLIFSVQGPEIRKINESAFQWGECHQ